MLRRDAKRVLPNRYDATILLFAPCRVVSIHHALNDFSPLHRYTPRNL
jgi:hypothetical protein